SPEFFWPDGLSKKLAYPYLQFASSGCFLKAGLTCNGCHATHGSDLKAELVADPGGVGLCARCHPEVAANVNAHTHHKPTGPGGNCNVCHLPKQFRNQLDMTDHRITVPVPENTVKLNIPNACNQSGCHVDQSAQWASDWARTWYGDYQQDRVARADAIHRGREGDVSAVPALLAMLQAEETAPLLRAGLVEILGKLGDRRALPQLVVALEDSHSAVRAQSSAALGRVGHPLAIRPLVKALSDSVFSVRIRAAYALALLDYVPQETHKKIYEDALDAFVSVVTGKGMMADDAHMHLNVGQIYEFRKSFDTALEHYRHALGFLPGLVEAQNRTQRLLEAEARYQKLVSLVSPVVERDVRAQVALGLAYVHRGKTKEGIVLLNQAISAGVRSDIVETGLGDAYRWLGQFDQAQQHYEQALQLMDTTPGAHRGMALLMYARGEDERGGTHWLHFEKAQQGGEARVRELMGEN
ncbi:MAG: HEAT repeat domain-containing protein, partial [Candidatus Latescibacterota bacterium]